MHPPHAYRPWLAMVLAPVLLGLAFVPVVAYVSRTRGVQGDDLVRAVEPLAAGPAAVGFLLVLALTVALARRDGRGLARLGWARPRLPDVGVGLLAGSALLVACQWLVYPAVRALRPGFDPTLASTPWPVALATFFVAAVAEDTLYRGYAFVRLRERHGLAVAVFATSAFYCVLAPGQGWPLNLFALGLGAALALLRAWRGCLFPVLVAHVVVSLGPKLLA